MLSSTWERRLFPMGTNFTKFYTPKFTKRQIEWMEDRLINPVHAVHMRLSLILMGKVALSESEVERMMEALELVPTRIRTLWRQHAVPKRTRSSLP